AVHPDDVTRIEQLMKDIDKGFWSFTTSYNSLGSVKFSFPKDPIYSTFAATRPPSNLEHEVHFSVRPSHGPKRIKSLLGHRAALYDFDFYFHATTGRLMDYRKILASTRQVHDRVVHIMLDSFQHSLRFTVPAVLPQERILRTVEAFWDACRNSVTAIPYYREKEPKRVSTSAFWKQHRERNAPFEAIASEWPHYVLPPSNPLTFLDSGMECSFFGA
ncbi:MAG: hypothetical protein MN733_33040, partial [Nitrososphaera sp.]|nr:hypothetical protein [Nitrososphaera sp.]